MQQTIFRETIIIKRYGEAFFRYLKKSAGFDNAISECRNLLALILANPPFRQFLSSPEIIHIDKINFIEKVLNSDFNFATKNFLKLLLEKGRIEKISDIIEYILLTYTYEGETKVLIRSTYPLELDLLREVESLLIKKIGKNLRFYIELDGSLLGGIQVIIGNKIIDGSVKRRLDDMKEKLSRLRLS